jgi:hypothetical protein
MLFFMPNRHMMIMCCEKDWLKHWCFVRTLCAKSMSMGLENVYGFEHRALCG